MNIYLDSIFEKYDLPTCLDTLQSLTKIASSTISFTAHFVVSEDIGLAKEITSGFRAVFTVRSTFNSLGKILKQVKNKDKKPKILVLLGTISSTVGIGNGILSLRKTFGSLVLSQFSDSLGNIPVLQDLLSSTGSVGHVASALSLFHSVVNITIESVHIYETCKKINHASQKIMLWKQPLDIGRVNLKILTITEKQIKLIQLTEEHADRLQKINQKTKKALTKYNQNKDEYDKSTFFKKFILWIPIQKEKKMTKKLSAKNLKRAKELDHFLKKQTASFNKLDAWEKMSANWGNMTLESLSKIQDEKKAKWKIKLKCLKFEQIKACFGLVLKIINLVVSIASIILSATGVGLLPVLLTMSTISLIMAITGFGFSLFKRHAKLIKSANSSVALSFS